MPTFTYTARDKSGTVTSGSVEAETDTRAAANLREAGLWVTDLKAARGSRAETPTQYRAPQAKQTLFQRLFPPVSKKDLSLFYRQLYTLLNSGMALFQALEILSNSSQSPNQHLSRAVRDLAQHVLAGRRLSEGMAQYPAIFDRMQLRMIEAGETGGLLVEVLERLAEYLQREFELRLEIKRKTLYPKILLGALLFIPSIPTLVLRGPSAYAAELWQTLQYVVLGLVPLFFVFRYVLSTDAGREFFDRVKLALPIIGPLVRKMTIARFARTLAALYGAGVPIGTALSTSGEACGNYVLESAGRRMVPALEQGHRISEALEASGFFPPMFNGMVQTGETSGNLDQMLTKAADFYDEEARHSTIQLTVIVSVGLLLLMGIIIGMKIIGYWSSFYGGVMGTPGEVDQGGAAGE